MTSPPLPAWKRALATILQVDLLRWGGVASVILAAGFLAGRCSVYYGGRAADRAQAAVDSARIAQAAAHRADSVHARAFALEHTRLVDGMQAAERAQPALVQRTVGATVGLQAAITAAARAAAAIPELKALIDTVQHRADSLARTVASERAGAARSLSRAHDVIHGDSLELERRATRIRTLEGDVQAGLTREEKLGKLLRGGWTLGVTIGPGGSLNTAPARLRVAPVQVTVGATHELHLPCLNPFGCRRG